MCDSDKRMILKLEKKNTELKAEIEKFKAESEQSKAELHDYKKGRLSNDTVFDQIIDDDQNLYATTGLERNEFEWILVRFENAVKNSPNAPRFSEYANESGNTCILSVRRVLFIALSRKRNNEKQEIFAAYAHIDQSTVSRYLALADVLLMKILPTAENIAATIRKERTIEAFKEFVPGKSAGELYLDATFVQVQRPQVDQKKAYSGKRKRYVYNIQITSNKDGLVLDVGHPEEGSAHDMEVLRRNPPNFGKWTKNMRDPNTKQEHRIILYTDKGYLGVEKDYPGIISKQPYKKPKGYEMTETDQKYNQRISRKRIRVEHAINRLKWFRRMSAVYDDSKEEFYKEIQVVTGLTNLHILFNDRKYVKPMERVCSQIK
ncbi:MAG: Transposase [Cenarchaeum symbiont of Oopsacas minuta]|nr:Transposase [Cenarchaeum symbiont of Oopsacas minuta]MDI1495851.1 Transposase [Cenarchaeum symbiont of Oopsacas minuta]